MGKFYNAVRDKSTDVTIAGGDTGVSVFNTVRNIAGGTEEYALRFHHVARNARRKGEAADALAFQKEVAIAVVTRTREVSEAFRDVQKALKEDKELEEIHNQLFGSFDQVMQKAMTTK